MVKWLLECESCGTKRILDVGYNLKEFKLLHIYCRKCGENKPHKVLGIEQ